MVKLAIDMPHSGSRGMRPRLAWGMVLFGGFAVGCSLPADDPGVEPAQRRAELVHGFGEIVLEPGEETLPCAAWTLHNDEPLYVETVTLGNTGGFHHSNWFVVPEDAYAGPDGYFDCAERGFDELHAAVVGTVLFAQSTQSQSEEQLLGEGVVVKIPPGHKVVGSLHLLNTSPRELETELRMGLDIIHPGDVETVAAPFRLTYRDLDIPAQKESRFTGECDLAGAYEQALGEPLELSLFWILPHYHELGNFFELSVVGGEHDGDILHQLTGFNAEANGASISPPRDLSDADALRFTCGYRNPRDEDVGWGIGDQEMCVLLGFADSDALFDGIVRASGDGTEGDDGVHVVEGPCEVTIVDKNDAQAEPTEEEKAGDLYVPEGGGEVDLEPVPTCEDTPASAEADAPATLAGIEEMVFAPSCTFSACHSGPSPAANLDLAAADLRRSLLEHEVGADTELPLVAPGDPEGSWLYHVMSRCEPTDDAGRPFPRMPLNATRLADEALVAAVRDWISAGAPAE